MTMVYGRVTRLESDGFGVVQLKDGKEAFFGRYAPIASKGGYCIHPGSEIIGLTKDPNSEVIRLETVQIA